MNGSLQNLQAGISETVYDSSFRGRSDSAKKKLVVDKHVGFFFFFQLELNLPRSLVMELQPSSRRPRQSRDSALPTPHNNEDPGSEFSANQPLHSVGAVRSIPVNPRLQMHSKYLLIYSKTTNFFPLLSS